MNRIPWTMWLAFCAHLLLPHLGLSAVAVSPTRVDLAWTDGDRFETGFRIERSAGGGWSHVATTSAGAAGYSDTGRLAEQRYDYRVQAEGAIGDSSWSATAEASTPTVPDRLTTSPRDELAMAAGGTAGGSVVPGRYYSFRYDASLTDANVGIGNRLSWVSGSGAVQTSAPNACNQVYSRSVAGRVALSGWAKTEHQVTVNGVPAVREGAAWHASVPVANAGVLTARACGPIGSCT